MIYNVAQPLSASRVIFPYKKAWNIDDFKQVASVTNIRYIERISENLVVVNPISLKFRIEGGYYCSEYNAGGLIVASAEVTLEDMIQDIKDQLKHAWEYYAEENDDNLNGNAKKVKKWLRANIREM